MISRLKSIFGIGNVLGMLLAYVALRYCVSQGWTIVALLLKIYLIISIISLVGLLLLIILPFLFLFWAFRSKKAHDNFIEAKYRVK